MKPNPKDYGWIDPNPALGEEGGWVMEGGEEAYEAAERIHAAHQWEPLCVDFDTWFNLFQVNCNMLGYKGRIDKYSFLSNWEIGASPALVATDFVAELVHEEVLEQLSPNAFQFSFNGLRENILNDYNELVRLMKDGVSPLNDVTVDGYELDRLLADMRRDIVLLCSLMTDDIPSLISKEDFEIEDFDIESLTA